MEYAESMIRNRLPVESHARKNLSEIAKRIEEDLNVRDPHACAYKCKECGNFFEKTQALCGHKAKHKRTRLSDGSSTSQMLVYECKVCGENFMNGQALGGHMRKHQGMKHNKGKVKTTESNKVGHVLQQIKVESLLETKVEALQDLKVDVLQEQKEKIDPYEGVMSKGDEFKEEASNSNLRQQEFQFCDLRVPVDEDEGALHIPNKIHTYYEFL